MEDYVDSPETNTDFNSQYWKRFSSKVDLFMFLMIVTGLLRVFYIADIVDNYHNTAISFLVGRFFPIATFFYGTALFVVFVVLYYQPARKLHKETIESLKFRSKLIIAITTASCGIYMASVYLVGSLVVLLTH